MEVKHSSKREHWSDHNVYVRKNLNVNFSIRSVFSDLTPDDTGLSLRCILEEHSLRKHPKTEENPDNIQSRSTSVVEDMVARIIPKKRQHSVEVIKTIVEVLFGHIVPDTISSNSLHVARHFLRKSLHPGVAPIYKMVETRDDLYMMQVYFKHSLLTLSRFHAKTSLLSPSICRGGGVGSRDLRLRFIFYQLLQVTAFIHEKGLCLDPLSPSMVSLDEHLWVSVPMLLTSRVTSCAALNSHTKKSDRCYRGTSPGTELVRLS